MSQVAILHRWVCPWGQYLVGKALESPWECPPWSRTPVPARLPPCSVLQTTPQGPCGRDKATCIQGNVVSTMTSFVAQRVVGVGLGTCSS